MIRQINHSQGFVAHTYTQHITWSGVPHIEIDTDPYEARENERRFKKEMEDVGGWGSRGRTKNRAYYIWNDTKVLHRQLLTGDCHATIYIPSLHYYYELSDGTNEKRKNEYRITHCRRWRWWWWLIVWLLRVMRICWIQFHSNGSRNLYELYRMQYKINAQIHYKHKWLTSTCACLWVCGVCVTANKTKSESVVCYFGRLSLLKDANEKGQQSTLSMCVVAC